MLYQAIQEQYGLLFWMNELFPILSESHLSWDADLVAVEVVDLLLAFAFCGCQVADLCQGFVCTVMPYIRIGGFMRATAYLYFLLH